MTWFRLGGAGRRVDSPREAALANRLQEQIQQQTEGSAVAGKALTVHASPFYLDVGAYLKAAAGPPAWSVRLARIDRLREELLEALHLAWDEHARRFAGRPEEFAAAWQEHVSNLDCSRLNELIDKHNRYYPIEAGLRMQWPSGRYIVPTGMVHPQPKNTPESLLGECPAALTPALSQTERSELTELKKPSKPG